MATPPNHTNLPLEPGTERLSSRYLDDREEEETTGLLDNESGTGNMDGLVDMIIYLRDRNGIFYSLEDGQQARADELLDMTLAEQGLPDVAREVFALWLVSDLMEIRLKKSHMPHQVAQQWDELCTLYTDAKLSEIEKSDPVLMIQRDVFFPRYKEMSISNEQILCLLYHEAKYNVLEGRYPLHPDDYHQLAGLQSLIHLGLFDRKQHVPVEYRANLHKFYPDHMFQKEKFLFFTRKDESAQCEERFQAAHIRFSSDYQHEDISQNLVKFYRKYLEICWSYPFYGSAFFSGQVETPCRRMMKMIKSPPDTKVLVAINTEGISIIDRDRVMLLLYAPYDQLLWEYREAEFDVDSDVMPSLYLQFLLEEQGEVTKLLQIYSREAKLMDALIQSCVTRKKLRRKEDGVDFVDAGLFPGSQDPSQASKLCKRLDKLCLTTYTKKGECID